MRLFVTTFLVASTCYAQSARDYYNELYAVGGLNRVLNRVCFDDSPELDTFFEFIESKVVRDVMTADGSLLKASRSFQESMKKDFLIVVGYKKGLSIGEDEYRLDNSSWVAKFFLDGATPARVRLDINRDTLRYKRSVEVQNADGTFRPVVVRYGRCEHVSPAIEQRGK